MLAAMEGTFVLADIGGYTQFLTGVGLKHAKEITSHLFNAMLKENKDRWRVANVMGDCLFFCVEAPETPKETYEHLRALYEQFRGAATDVAARSTCDCGACNAAGELSLKFVVHAGEYDTQDIGGRRELIGEDIVVATRLLKNSVPLREYALLTESVSSVAEASALVTEAGRDALGDVGDVEYRYVDLTPVRREFEERRQVFVSEENSRLSVKVEIEAPAQVVWDAIKSLEKRRQWQLTIVEMELTGGREGSLGEIHRCVHDDGNSLIHMTVGIDEAGRRKTEKIWVVPRLISECYITLRATPLGEARTEAAFLAKFQPKLPVVSHAFIPLFKRVMRRTIEKDMEGLKALCETGKAGPGV